MHCIHRERPTPTSERTYWDEHFVKWPNALILWQRGRNFIYTRYVCVAWFCFRPERAARLTLGTEAQSVPYYDDHWQPGSQAHKRMVLRTGDEFHRLTHFTIYEWMLSSRRPGSDQCNAQWLRLYSSCHLSCIRIVSHCTSHEKYWFTYLLISLIIVVCHRSVSHSAMLLSVAVKAWFLWKLSTT